MNRWNEFFDAVAEDLEEAGYWEMPHGPQIAYELWRGVLERPVTDEAQARKAAASE